MRVRFLRDRDWTPAVDRRVTYAFAAGSEATVKRSWGDQMVAEGVAEEIAAPPRAVETAPAAEVRNARRG